MYFLGTKERKYFFTGFILLVVYLSPFLLLQQEAYHDPHDSLDYYVSIMTAADKSGDLLNLHPESIVKPVLGGIPRSFFHNNFDFMVLLFSVFKPFVAFLINFILVHIIAYCGLFFFLKNHVLENKSTLVIMLSAFLFSILPQYPMLGITLAGVPMVLNSFFNIYRKSRNWIDLFIIIFFAFYSSIIYIGIFILILLGIWLVLDWKKKKVLNMRLFWSIFLLGSAYLLFNYLLFYQVLFSSMESHREEWRFNGYNWKVVVWAIKNMFINGHHHAASLQQLVILCMVPLAFIISKLKNKTNQLLLKLVVVAGVISVFYGFAQWNLYINLREKYTILKVFQWDRFYFFNPTLWGVILSLAMATIFDLTYRNYKLGKVLVIGFFLFQTGLIINNDSFYKLSFSSMIGKESVEEVHPTYRAYFQEELMENIYEYIGKPKNEYRVGAVGMNTAVLQYNGFYTVDGYMTSYPLSYKHKFRKVVINELEKNERMKAYFDDWGHRCYLFSDEDFRGIDSITGLDWNFEELKKLGCEYIFSYKSIDLNNVKEMILDKKFVSDYNQKAVYLYKVI